MDKHVVKPQETVALITTSVHTSMLKRECICRQHTIARDQYADCRKKWPPSKSIHLAEASEPGHLGKQIA